MPLARHFTLWALALSLGPSHAVAAGDPADLRLDRIMGSAVPQLTQHPAPGSRDTPRLGGRSVLRQRYSDVIRSEPGARAETVPELTAPLAEQFRKGQQLEKEGRTREATDAYLAAARAGHGPAQKRLGVIYGRGSAEVPRDYAESIQWYDQARRSGEEVAEPLQFTTPRVGH